MGQTKNPHTNNNSSTFDPAGRPNKNRDNFDITDLGWTGHLRFEGNEIVGEVDTDKLIADHGYDPLSPLELLVSAVIAAHPAESRSTDNKRQVTDNDRLEMAVAALTGKPRRPGRNRSDDYDILLSIAWGYLEALHQGIQEPEVAPIVKRCLVESGRLPETLRRLEDGEHSEIRRLRNKFMSDKDLLLARVTSENDYDRMDTLRAVIAIATALKRLGVALDLDAIRPRFRPREKTAV